MLFINKKHNRPEKKIVLNFGPLEIWIETWFKMSHPGDEPLKEFFFNF